jgi:hypothetical protein
VAGEPFARSISVDYSDDELDAIAEAFTRRDIARRERAGDATDPIRRAQNQTALRGLVARRAIALGGSAARPRMEFLEPHATLLGAFLRAEAVATIRRERGPAAETVSLFADGDVVVEQAPRASLAIQRMTAHGRAAAPELLRRELDLAPRAATTSATAGGEQIELTKRAMTAAVAAIEQGGERPECCPERAWAILYARTESGSVTISVRERSGRRSAEKWSWADGGELGFWRVRSEPDSPLVRLVSADAGALAGEIDGAWAAALG